MDKLVRPTYGILLCLAIAVSSRFLSSYLPLGSVAIALLLGIFIGSSVNIGEKFKIGILFSEKVLLPLSIALLGVNLDYFILKELGWRTIFLIVIAISFSISSSVYIARFLDVKYTQALLIGIGNGICGSSAIAATNNLIKAEEEDVGLAIAVVNFLGTVGMLMLPLFGTIILKFTDIQVGILIGNTLQAVGQAAAGGFSVSDTAGQTAIIVKMGRILMITPFLLILIAIISNKKSLSLKGSESRQRQRIPVFILGFIFFSMLSTFHIVTESQLGLLSILGNILLLVAMSGIALKIKIFNIIRNGKQALMLGCVAFLVQILFSTCVIYALF